MRTLPQQDHCDLGLVDDDDTEVLTKRKAPTAIEALQYDHRAVTTTTKEIYK
jgi:hypothetical protein